MLDAFHLNKYIKKGTGHLRDSVGDGRDRIHDAISFEDKDEIKRIFDIAIEHAETESKKVAVYQARTYILNHWDAIIIKNEISSLESKVFFQLIDLRYTKRSTIFTSNLTFDKWPTILGGDEMITKAILDRILHYSYLFNITGPSYRIKDKIKSRPNNDDLQGIKV